MTFKIFLKHVRSDPAYDRLMYWKETEHCDMKSDEFLASLYIHQCLDQKLPIHAIIKTMPAKYDWILKDVMKARLNPKKIYVNWTMVKYALKGSSGYCRDFETYLMEYHPQRK